jgi:hypothetical protein
VPIIYSGRVRTEEEIVNSATVRVIQTTNGRDNSQITKTINMISRWMVVSTHFSKSQTRKKTRRKKKLRARIPSPLSTCATTKRIKGFAPCTEATTISTLRIDWLLPSLNKTKRRRKKRSNRIL